MPRATDSLYLHPVQILSFPRGATGNVLHRRYRCLVLGLHRRRALPWFAFVPGHQRVQSAHTYHRHAWVRIEKIHLSQLL